jgi:hypothetical protein
VLVSLCLPVAWKIYLGERIASTTTVDTMVHQAAYAASVSHKCTFQTLQHSLVSHDTVLIGYQHGVGSMLRTMGALL